MQTPTECSYAALQSPPAAIMEKINTPPWGNPSDAIIRLPGHKFADASPVSAQEAKGFRLLYHPSSSVSTIPKQFENPD